jgi:spore germination cell wall hydrolase CwlJ-like protein
VLLACLAAIAGCCAAYAAVRGVGGDVRRIAEVARALDARGLARLAHGMDAGGLALAQRADPTQRRADFWDRARGWRTLDLTRPPDLPLGELTPVDAARLNAALPADDADFAPARPFVLAAQGPERERAVLCMTQAVYYEAATEPLEGQQAVAQTVINRIRHPDFPKSVCGVVYEGSTLPTGCQFSFTCDGSLARPPVEPYWSRARAVAEAALGGFVARAVGSSTHYHADYVFPRWGPQMVKVVQLGAHVFYRYPGPAGAPQTLTGEYAGGELGVSLAGPPPGAMLAARAGVPPDPLAHAPAGDAAPDPVLAALHSPATADRSALVGRYVFGRRIPTREEVEQIDAELNGAPGGQAAAPPSKLTAAPSPAG